jgi:hypothetical protein
MARHRAALLWPPRAGVDRHSATIADTLCDFRDGPAPDEILVESNGSSVRDSARQGSGGFVIAMRFAVPGDRDPADISCTAPRRQPIRRPFEHWIAGFGGGCIGPVEMEGNSAAQYVQRSRSFRPTKGSDPLAAPARCIGMRPRAIGDERGISFPTLCRNRRDQRTAAERLVIGMRRQDQPGALLRRGPCRYRSSPTEEIAPGAMAWRYHHRSSPQQSSSSHAAAARSRAWSGTG